MSEKTWKLGEQFRGPEDLKHLWIDLGAEPLYTLLDKVTVYARHRICEFFIALVENEADRAALLKTAQETRGHDITLVIGIDRKTFDRIEEASGWVSLSEPDFVNVPVIDVFGGLVGEIRMNSIDGTHAGSDVGSRAQFPVIAGTVKPGEFITCHLVNENRQRFVYEVTKRYAKTRGGITVQRVLDQEGGRGKSEIIDVCRYEIVYSADNRGLVPDKN